MSGPSLPEPRYQVQFYTHRHDGTKEYCVCDYFDYSQTGRSPIVTDDRGCNRLWTSPEEAQKAADELNQVGARP